MLFMSLYKGYAPSMNTPLNFHTAETDDLYRICSELGKGSLYGHLLCNLPIKFSAM